MADQVTVVSDAHTAKVWDDVAAEVDQDFLNPNEELRELVEEDHGRLVFNGDMIDYFFADYEGGERSNWDLFFDVVDNYDQEYLCNLGNHEYRSYAYNFDIYGLEHVQLPSDIRRGLPENLHKYFRWFKELRSILLDNTNTLEGYPFQRYHSSTTDLGRLVFLDTGPDAFADLRNFSHLSRIPDILSTHIISRGLDDAQLQFLEEELSTATETCYLFLHTPPFFSYDDPERIEVTESTYKQITRSAGSDHGFDYVGFLENNWRFMRTLLETERNIVVITGHTHVPGQFLLDKESRILRESSIEEINDALGAPGYIKFISNLPLGAIKGENKKTGYLKITDDSLSYSVTQDFA